MSRRGTSPRELAQYVVKDGAKKSPDAETEAYSSGEEDNTPSSTLRARKRATSMVRARTDYVATTLAKTPQAQGATVIQRIDEATGRANVILHNPTAIPDTFIEKLKQMMPWAAVRVDVKPNESYKDPATGGVTRGTAVHVSFDISKVIARDQAASGYSFHLCIAIACFAASLLLFYWIYAHVAPYW